MPWDKLILLGPNVAVIALMIWGVVKLGPIWKDVKLRELDIRNIEAAVKQQEAGVLTKLADSLAAFADVLQRVAVDHRRASEEMTILQRVNAGSANQLTAEVKALSTRLDRLERTHHVEPENTGTGEN